MRRIGNAVGMFRNEMRMIGNDVRRIGSDVRRIGNDVRRIGSVVSCSHIFLYEHVRTPDVVQEQNQMMICLREVWEKWQLREGRMSELMFARNWFDRQCTSGWIS